MTKTDIKFIKIILVFSLILCLEYAVYLDRHGNIDLRTLQITNGE